MLWPGFKTWVLVMMFNLTAAFLPTEECKCGYGGLCLTRWEDWTECHLCDEISGGFYMDCSVIHNHCASSPCLNFGVCRQTWGSFYCECEEQFLGKRCEYYVPYLEKLRISNQASVYYQVQPEPNGVNEFYIIYDPGDPVALETLGFAIRINVSLSDGRVFFPLRGVQILLKDTHDLCHRNANRNLALYDSRVCDMIPRGDSWTYRLDITNYDGFRNRSESSLILSPTDGHFSKRGEVIGLVGTLRLTIELRDLYRGSNYLLFEEQYTVFEYKKYRRPHRCYERISFLGCSNKTTPMTYSRGSSLKIQAIISKWECSGTLSVAYEWYLQRNLELDGEYKFDAEPIRWKSLNFQKSIIIPKKTLDPGLHMIMFAEGLRGSPPHYGATSSFRVYGRCWVKIILKDPIFQVERGAQFSTTCTKRLFLPIRLTGTSSVRNDFILSGTCDHNDDAECVRCPVQGFSIMKSFTPCNKTYNFTLVLTRRQTRVAFRTNVLVHFRDFEFDLYNHCMYNCYPIDTNRRTLFRAVVTPFIHGQVTWKVFVEDEVVDATDGKFDLFSFSTSSRILRVDGPRLIQSGRMSSNVLVQVEKDSYVGHPNSTTSINTLSTNLTYWVQFLKLERDRNGNFYFNLTTQLDPLFIPLRYRIYCLFNITRGFFLLRDTTSEDDLHFIPTGDAVMICVSGGYSSEACSRIHHTPMQISRRFGSSLEEMSERLKPGDPFFNANYAVVFQHRNIINNGTHMFWNVSFEERIELLRLFQNLQMVDQHDIMIAVNFLSAYFWSRRGSETTNLPIYVEDREIHTDFHKGRAWMNLQYSAFRAFKNIASVFIKILEFRQSEFLSPLGGSLDLLVQAWSMFYLQRHLKVNQSGKTDEWLMALVEFQSRFLFEYYEDLNLLLGKILNKLVIPYYGVRLFGLKHSRVYLVCSTYRGIMNSLNRSQPAQENWPHFTDHVFGPPNQTDEKWWDSMDLEFPPLPSNYSQLFSLVAFVAKKRILREAVTPFVFLQLRLKDSGKSLLTLPNRRPFLVTFPVFIPPEYYVSLFSKFTIVKPASRIRGPLSRYLVAIRLVQPVTFEDILIIPIKQYNHDGGRQWTLKVKCFLDSHPDFDDMADAFPLNGNVSVRPTEIISSIIVYPRNRNTTVPTQYFLVFVLDDSVAPGSYEFGLPWFAPVCEVISKKYATQHACKGKLMKNSIKSGLKEIKCACSHFGYISANLRPIRQVLALNEPINVLIPKSYEALVIAACTGVIICSLVLLLTAVYFDVRRAKSADVLVFTGLLQVQVSFVADAYPSDEYLVLVGVYTGMNLFAGSWSRVAIKIVGDESSSRVHILNLTSKRALGRMRDDWFLVPVRRPLGKIISVFMWHDFHWVSDWYCSCLIIFDFTTSSWYFADVKRWFKLHDNDEESQMFEVSPVDVTESPEEMNKLEETFLDYYFRELQNTHIPLSAFTMHPRCIGSYEHICIVFLLKFFGLFLLSWLLQVVGFTTIFKHYSHVPRDLTRVTSESLVMVLFITLLSRVFSTPCSFVYRWYIRSRHLQFKLTTPLLSDAHSNFGSPGTWSRPMSPNIVGSSPNLYPMSDNEVDPSENANASSPGSLGSPTRSEGSNKRKRTQRSTVSKSRSKSPYATNSRARFASLSPSSVSAITRASPTTSPTISPKYTLIRQRSPDKSNLSLFTQKVTTFLGYRPDRMGLLPYFFGPTQLGLVNVPMEYFRFWMRGLIKTKCIVAAVLVLLLAFFLYVELFSNHFTQYKQTLCFVMMGLLFDAVVMEPLFIFLKSLAAFSIFKFSHTEKYLIDETQVLQVRFVQLTHAEYIERVKHNSYHPLLSTQLLEKHVKQRTVRFVLLSWFFLCILATVFCLYLQISCDSRPSIWASRRSVMSLYARPYPVHGDLGPSLSDVKSSKSFGLYITTNFVAFNSTWPNSKNISSSGMKWGKDRFSVPMGATNVIFQILPEEQREKLEASFWNENRSERSTGLFSLTKSLSERDLLKDPVIIAHEERSFNVTYTTEYIVGPSGKSFSYEGHYCVISHHPWVEFYGSVKKLLVEAFIEDDNLLVQTVIISSNFMFPHLAAMMTVDVIYEDSFVDCKGAAVQVHITQLFDYRYEEYPSVRVRLVNTCLFFFLFLGNIVIVSKVGITAYFTTFTWLVIAFNLVTIFLCGMSSAYLYYIKFEDVAIILNTPIDVYMDLHRVYLLSDLLDGVFSSSAVFMSMAALMVALTWALSMERFKLSMPGSFQMGIFITLLLLMVFLLVRVINCAWGDPKLNSLMQIVVLGDFLPVTSHHQKYWNAYFIIAVAALVIIKSSSKALVIGRYLSIKLPEPSIRYIKTYQPASEPATETSLSSLSYRHHESFTTTTRRKSRKTTDASDNARTKVNEKTSEKLLWIF